MSSLPVPTTPRRTLPTAARRVLSAVIIAIAFWSIIIMLFEDAFIYFPSRYPDGPYDQIPRYENVEECEFVAEDGVRLHGVFFRARDPLATVIFSHGNAGNLSHRLDWASRMQHAGLSVFLFDYRGYGKSEGSPSEDGLYKDATAAYDLVRRSFATDNVPIILWGRSLGGAIAAELATRRPATALILESTFTSAADVASLTVPYLPFIGSLLRTRLDSRACLTRLPIPSLHIHGSEDEVIPIRLGKDLHDCASGPKEWYVIQGAHHNDTFIVGGSEYITRIRRFITASAAPASFR